jgi:hypothetical protein
MLALPACRQSPVPTTTTTVLDAPEARVSEPTIAIDPLDPDRMMVAAMRGIPPVITSTGIRVWSSTDGGRSWTGAQLVTPRLSGDTGQQNFGADPVVRFAEDAAPLLVSMSQVGSRMATFVSRVVPDAANATTVRVFENLRDSLTGGTVFYDKPWLVVDRVEGSPHRGTVYASSGELVMSALPAKLGEPWAGPLVTRVVLAASRDGGRTFSAPVRVSDSAFGGQLAVTAGGVLEVTYARLVNMQASGNAVFHRRSTDGGASFGPPETITVTAGDTLLDTPVLASRPNGDLLACWSQGVRTDERNNQVRCAVRAAGRPWSRLGAIDPTLPGDAAEAWPAIVGTDRGWYLMQYVVTSGRTEVVLYRSAEGVTYERMASLGNVEGLGFDRFCLNAVTPCRRSRSDGFAIGDYVSIAASRGRLAAAYVLPRESSSRSYRRSLRPEGSGSCC